MVLIVTCINASYISNIAEPNTAWVCKEHKQAHWDIEDSLHRRF